MKATLRIGQWEHSTGLTRAFILALLLGGEVLPKHDNPNQPADICKFDDQSLQLIVDEGRAQVERQNDRFRSATDRGQILLTVNLALLGFIAALLHHLLQLHGIRETAALAAWGVSATLAILATAAAAAVVVVKGRFGGIDTTKLTTFEPPLLLPLAREYAKAVRTGELTADIRVTAFRSATRLAVYAGMLAAVGFGISA